MPYRPPFPIPENIHAELQCFQMCIPNDPTWKQVIAGLLDELNQWYNWQRDDARSGKECAQVWREIYAQIDWSIMSCCCPEPEPEYTQITPQGVYQTSPDGTTWTDDPNSDPRTTQPFYPPYLPPETVEAECTYADSIVTIIRDDMVDILEDGQGYAEVLGIIVAIFTTLMGALSPTIIGALIVGILGAIIAGIVALGIPAFQAAMTTAVYDRLRCNLHDNQQADGSFTQADIDTIYARIGTEETGLAMSFLQQVVAAASMVGLTNMARAGRGAADAECCVAPSVDIYVSTGGGTEVSRVGNVLTAQAIFAGGQYLLYLQITPNPGDNPDDCAYMYPIATVGSFAYGEFYYCGATTPTYPGLSQSCDNLLTKMALHSGSTFTVEVTGSTEPNCV